LKIITPTGLTIPGADTINATIEIAPEGSKIILDPKTYYENVIVSKSVGIVGSIMGKAKTVVDGSHVIGHKSNFGSVFTVALVNHGNIVVKPDLKVTISDMTIQGGSGYSYTDGSDMVTQGGGICNYCTLTVIDCIISGNKADYGGGISGGQTTSLIRSTISNNVANKRGGGFSTWESGEMNILECTISKNSAGKEGGGIFNMARMNVQDGSISDNNASINGGGIANSHKLVLRGKCQVSNNQAAKGFGGGVYSSIISVEFDGMNLGVKNNRAHLPVSLKPLQWYIGWGVYVDSGSPVVTGGFNPATQVTGNTQI
jgi:predicted outer membrane repeat protein